MTDKPVAFTVRGLPVPQGSVRAFVAGGRAHVAARSAPLMAWRTAIATAASTAMADRALLEGPLSVDAMFYLPRPASLPKKRVTYPSKRPDLDKLTRALCDALTGVVWRDDAQVVVLYMQKLYAFEQYPPGVSVWVEGFQP